MVALLFIMKFSYGKIPKEGKYNSRHGDSEAEATYWQSNEAPDL